jgi:hypothetical protein
MAETTTPEPETETTPEPTTEPVTESTSPQPDQTPVPEAFHIWHESSGVTLQDAILKGENGVWIPSEARGDAASIDGTMEALGDRTSGVYTLHGVAANMVPDGATFGTYANGTAIKVTILFRVDPVEGLLRCVFYNTTSLVWEVVEGSALIENTLILRCDTAHFTDFAAAEESTGGSASDSGADTPTAVAGATVVFGVVMGVLLGLVIFFGIQIRMARHERNGNNVIGSNTAHPPTLDEAVAFLLSPRNGRRGER